MIPKLSDLDFGLSPGRAMNVCVVSSEFLGPVKNGGIATATSGLLQQLASEGHKVTLLYTLVEYGAPASGDRSWSHWVNTLALEGIALAHIPHGGDYRSWLEKSWHVKEFLGQHEFDLVYFNEHHGSGYYAILAKRAGLLPFANQLHCVITHGSMEWVFALNDQYACRPADVEMIGLERRSVELADFVIAPSTYLLNEYAKYGWSLPARTYQHPYALYRKFKRIVSASPLPIKELVFFGRLEVRKGLWLFCEALDRLRDRLVGKTVTFLGRTTENAGLSSGLQIIHRAQNWGCRVKLLNDLDQEQAIGYLSGRGRLAVMPSLADNSPCVLYECMEAGIPFISTRGSGGDELVHPDCWEEMMVEPTADSLTMAIERILDQGAKLGTPRFDPEENLKIWSDWHRFVSTERESLLAFGSNKDASPSQVAQNSGRPVFVFIDSKSVSISTMIANLTSHIKRFGAAVEYLVVSAREETLTDIIASLSPERSSPSIRFFDGSKTEPLKEIVSSAKFAFFMDANTEIQSPFFLLACNLLGRPTVGLVSCVVATRGDQSAVPTIEKLPTGYIPGAIGLGYVACGSAWAISGQSWNTHASDVELYDTQNDELISSLALGERVFQRCIKASAEVHMLPLVGAIETHESINLPSPGNSYRDVRRSAAELEIQPLVKAGGPAWFAMSALGIDRDEGLERGLPSPVPGHHPLAHLRDWSDLPLAAASMGRSELSLQLQIAAGISESRVRQLIDVAADAFRKRPQQDLAQLLRSKKASEFGVKPWPDSDETHRTNGSIRPTSPDSVTGSLTRVKRATDENITLGENATIYIDARRIRCLQSRVRSVSSLIKFPGKLIFFDIPLCGNISLSSTLKSLGREDVEVRLTALDQMTGNPINSIMRRLGRNDHCDLLVELHRVFGHATFVFEFSGAGNLEVEIESMILS